MDFRLNPFSLLLFFSFLLNIGFFFMIYYGEKRFNGYSSFLATLLINTLYCLFYGLELAQTDLESALFFLTIQHLFLPMSVPFVFLFSVNYTGILRKFIKGLKPVLFAFPITTILIAQSNSYHSLMYENPNLNEGSFFYFLSFKPGFWYEVNEVFELFFLFLTIVIFLKAGISNKGIFRKQMLLIAFAIFFPILTLSLPFFDITPHGLDLVPYGLTGTILIIYIAFYYTDLFNLVPQARASILDQMEDAFLIVDNNLRILDSNKAFHRTFSDSSVQIGNRLESDHFDWIPENDFRKMASSKTTINKSYSFHSTLWFNVKSIPFYDNNNTKMIGKIFIFSNVTEDKLKEEQIHNQNETLKKINAEKDLLFSIISHDLRSPLSGVVGLSGLIQEELDEAEKGSVVDMEELRDSFKSFHKTTDTLFQLVNNLLEWSRLHVNQNEPNKQKENLVDIIREVLDLYKSILKNKGILMELQLPEFLPAHCNREMIATVFRNLINNAIKFTPGGNKIRIEHLIESDHILVSIIDSGIGIPKESIPNLFEVTSQLRRKGTDGEPTSGLGLPLVYELLKRNEAEVEVFSEEGKGSRFVLKFPAINP